MKKKKRGFIKRTLRFFAWTALTAVLAAVCAVALLNRFITQERLHSIIVEQLQQTFHRPVKIDRVTFLLHQGIKVSGLQVSESEAFPGETFLSSESLTVKFRLVALLSGRVELSKVLLLSPRIRLTRRADGVWNIQDMLRAEGAAPRLGRRIALPPLQVADVISIERGMINVSDLAGRKDLKFSDLRLMVVDFNVDNPFSAEMSFDNENDIGGKRVKARVELEARVSLAGLRADDAFLTADRLRVAVNGNKLAASGSLQDFAHPVVDLTASLPRVTTAELSPYFAVPEGIDIPASQWRLKLAAEKEPGTGYRVDRLDGSAGTLRVVASGSLRPAPDSSRMTLSFAPTTLQDAAAVYAPWAERRLSGTVSGSLTLAGSIERPAVEKASLTVRGLTGELRKGQRVRDMNVVFSGREGLRSLTIGASGGSYSAYANTLADVALDMDITEGDMAVRRFDGVWNASRFRIAACVKDAANPSQVSVSASVDRLRIDETYEAIKKIIALRKEELGRPDMGDLPWSQVFKYSIPATFPDFQGRLAVAQADSPNFKADNVELLWDLEGISKGLNQVSGNVRLGFGPGRFSDIPKVREAHRLLNVLLLPYVYMHEVNAKAVLSLDTASPKTLDLARIEGDFGLAKGLAEVRYLQVRSPQFQAYADGYLHFPQEKVDMKILMRLTSVRGQLPDRLVDTLGRPSLELLLKDDLNKPTPDPTLRKMGSDDIEEAAAKAWTKGKVAFPVGKELSCVRRKE